jgi:hypothetical protein
MPAATFAQSQARVPGTREVPRALSAFGRIRICYRGSPHHIMVECCEGSPLGAPCVGLASDPWMSCSQARAWQTVSAPCVIARDRNWRFCNIPLKRKRPKDARFAVVHSGGTSEKVCSDTRSSVHCGKTEYQHWGPLQGFFAINDQLQWRSCKLNHAAVHVSKPEAEWLPGHRQSRLVPVHKAGGDCRLCKQLWQSGRFEAPALS